MEKELSAKDKAVETLQHQLTQAQAEIERLKGAHVGERTPSLGTGHGTEAQQHRQTQGARDPRTDDMAPDSGDGQQISGSRKRKVGDTGSDSRTGELHPWAGSCSGNNTTPGLSAERQDPSTRNLSNLTIANLRDPTYVTDPPIPAEVLSRLRENLHGWDRRKADWAKPRIGRRCVESIVSKKASVWPHGEGAECEHCKKHKKLCMVVEKGGRLTFLPPYQGGFRCSRTSPVIERYTRTCDRRSNSDKDNIAN